MESQLNEIELGQLCRSAEDCLAATGTLSSFPGLLKKIIKTEAWKHRHIVDTRGMPRSGVSGGIIELPNLRALITEKPLKGWGEDPTKIEAVIRDDPECLVLYREAMTLPVGTNQHNNNIITQTEKTTQGTSKSYTLDRLKRESPELYQQVTEKKISANAAAIQAGFRKKTVSVALGDPQRLVVSLRNHMTVDQWEEFVQEVIDTGMNLESH